MSRNLKKGNFRHSQGNQNQQLPEDLSYQHHREVVKDKKFVSNFIHAGRNNRMTLDPDVTPHFGNSSVEGPERSQSKKATFPFKLTPSGNLKVQSNQVAFQSSGLGVVLADPAQTKVNVKFEETDDDTNSNLNNDSSDHDFQLQYGRSKTPSIVQANALDERYEGSRKYPACREDKGKDLKSLGYTVAGPIDWTKMQLPEKKDLFQEFFRRIRNHVNTDAVIHIANEEFHCHQIVLQIYSPFFDSKSQKTVELPLAYVTPEAFHTIYEWMLYNGSDSYKMLKVENIIDILRAAQYLSIEDLEDQCWSLIANEAIFTEDTAYALFREANRKGVTSVTDMMVPRVTRFFLPLAASKDFLNLEVDEVLVLLNSNYICVTSEIEVLMAGIRWLYGDWSNRRQYAVDVMRCVRFGLISPWQLVDIKRNPDNGEILEVINDTEVQQMVDDGLAYVIIKYWYGNDLQNYFHWINVLGLTEPTERCWIGEEENHLTYKDFLKYLERFMVPKDEMYKQMAVNQGPRNSNASAGGLRRSDPDKMDNGSHNFNFPLPMAFKNLGGREGFSKSSATSEEIVLTTMTPNNVSQDTRVANDADAQRAKLMKDAMLRNSQYGQIYDPPEKDSIRAMNSNKSEASSESTNGNGRSHKRHSVAASYLAAATAALSGARNAITPSSPPTRGQKPGPSRQEASLRAGTAVPGSREISFSPDISLFNQSKESWAKMNMNKLSTSILGVSNKNYTAEGSLFNWDRETVLVFGGVDPHSTYGTGRNTGREVYKFDPVSNIWENVGELPEPRHHHSVAFLRGRVYLVGGADPRDDDTRGKSVVVSTVWSFEPVSKSWYSESGLATPRKNFGLIVHRMALYAIGGQDKKGRVLRSVERFDPKTGSWTEVRSMGVARMAIAATKYREYIWVAGGMTGEKKKPVCRIVECYNSKTNQWTEIYNLRIPRCFATLFAMNDKLYLIGGAGKVNEKEKTASSMSAIDVWDWKERTWKLETEMSIPRHGHALAYLGTQLIIIGGVTTIYMRALSNVESFCCERGAWIRGVASLPSPLSGHGAITLPPASLM